MTVRINSRRAGVYCARKLGDEPCHSSTGCRFYVYVGRACAAWLDYHDLDVAVAENPGEPVFDRATIATPSALTRNDIAADSSAQPSRHRVPALAEPAGMTGSAGVRTATSAGGGSSGEGLGSNLGLRPPSRNTV
jgi:hypothetical protein